MKRWLEAPQLVGIAPIIMARTVSFRFVAMNYLLGRSAEAVGGQESHDGIDDGRVSTRRGAWKRWLGRGRSGSPDANTISRINGAREYAWGIEIAIDTEIVEGGTAGPCQTGPIGRVGVCREHAVIWPGREQVRCVVDHALDCAPPRVWKGLGRVKVQWIASKDSPGCGPRGARSGQ